jgi:uncharacterized protein (DUF1810 family)
MGIKSIDEARAELGLDLLGIRTRSSPATVPC